MKRFFEDKRGEKEEGGVGRHREESAGYADGKVCVAEEREALCPGGAGAEDGPGRGVRQRSGDEGKGKNADGNVDEEDGLPTGADDKESADSRAEGRPEGGRGGDDTEGAADLVFWESGRDGGSHQGGHAHGSAALDEAEGDEPLDGWRESAEERTSGKQGDAGKEDAFLTEATSEIRYREKQQDDECEIALDDPLDGREVGLKFPDERGDGDVHDAAVEREHENADRHASEGEPLSGGMGWAVAWHGSCQRIALDGPGLHNDIGMIKRLCR